MDPGHQDAPPASPAGTGSAGNRPTWRRARACPACLTNLLPLCTFHHLIAVHRWGWGIVLLPDGTVTATSPDHDRTLHSHGPPKLAA